MTPQIKSRGFPTTKCLLGNEVSTETRWRRDNGGYPTMMIGDESLTRPASGLVFHRFTRNTPVVSLVTAGS